MARQFAGNLKELEVQKFSQTNSRNVADILSVEEPLEIRIGRRSEEKPRSIAVTMRTPGDDAELAAGFLFTESILASRDDIEEIVVEGCNVTTVYIRDALEIDHSLLERHSFVNSSCGVCGKKSIGAVKLRINMPLLQDLPLVDPQLIHELPGILRQYQDDFQKTGGIHASCLFNASAELLNLREDVGRHNALDKLIGAEFLANKLPLQESILLLSGRISFELVQKAAQAGIGMIAAVGAPSTLAVELAQECGITLIGFLRDQRFNVYAGAHRLRANHQS